jgi:hypothetical protein
VRTSFASIVWLGAVFGMVGWVRGDIAYHFKPGIEGQVVGFTQFAEVAPDHGDKDFKVRLSGGLIGSAPSADATTARAYLDKWGLGVLNPAAGKDIGVQGQVQVDGRHGGEYLRLEFEVPVHLTLLTFASVSKGEDVEILADGALVDLDVLFPGTKTIRDISSVQGNWPGTIDFTKAQQATPFAKRWEVVIGSSVFGDGIQLENVRVELVPEPASLLLSAIGFVALAIWGARRRNR